MSKLLFRLKNRIRQERWLATKDAIVDLWKRNGLTTEAERQGYKIEEGIREDKNGVETISYQLWKLVDQTVITISPDLNVKTEIGKEPTHDIRRDNSRSDTNAPI